MKAAPLTVKPPFPLMKQGDIQNIYHLQMPRWLFDNPRYMGLALEAKVAYTFLLNRFHLSRRNGWTNEDGAVFIIYTRHSLAEEIQVSYRKIIKAMKELSAAGLIWEKRCGQGRANQIYLALVECAEAKRGSIPFAGPEQEVVSGSPEDDTAESNRNAESASLDEILCPVAPLEMPEQHFKKCENGISRSAGMELQEVPKWHPSYKEKSYTDLIHTESSSSVSRQTDAELLKSRDGQTEVVGPDSRKPQQYQSMYSEPFKLFRICKTVSNAINSLDIAVVSGVEPQLLPQGRNEVRYTCGRIPIILVPNAFVYLLFTEYNSWVAREKIEYIELFYCQRNRIAIYIYPSAQRVNG